MNVIEVSNLSKAFNNKTALQDVSFSIKQGSFTALLGRNGSGKSTILNILMGNEKIDSGECSIFGMDIKKDPAHLKNDIGHVSEKIKFNYPMKVEEFLVEYGKLFEQFDMDWLKAAAKDLDIPLNKQFGGYSRGQKMQIVLLASLAHKPKLVLVDEVTSVLDAFSRNYFMKILKDFTLQGGTVVITTNIVNEVQFHCTDVIFLDALKIKFQTELSKIPSNFKKIRIKDPHHPLLQSNEVVWVGINSDGSQTFIASEEVLKSFDNFENDYRATTLEDLYIYHSQKA